MNETTADRLQRRLDAIRDHRPTHPIVPIDVFDGDWSRAGTCAVCDEPIVESADYRGDRWRHVS